VDHNLRLAPRQVTVASPALANSLDVYIPLIGAGVVREVTGIRLASSIDIAAHSANTVVGTVFKSDATAEAGLDADKADAAKIIASFTTDTDDAEIAFDKGIYQTLAVSSDYAAVAVPTTTQTPDGTTANLPRNRTFEKQLDADETLYLHLVVAGTSPAAAAVLYTTVEFVEGKSQTW
jgi:hypothetical protein